MPAPDTNGHDDLGIAQPPEDLLRQLQADSARAGGALPPDPDRVGSIGATMFDLPAILIVGPSKILLEHPGAITSLYRGVGERCTREGAVRVSWDRGSLPSSRFTKILPS